MHLSRIGNGVLCLAALALATACANQPTVPDSSSATPRFAIAATTSGTSVFDNTPTVLPPNLPSIGFQATQTAEFGDYIALAGTMRRARSATVIMSDWAKHSDYPAMDAAGFTHPITLNIYAVDHSNLLVPARGALLGTVTTPFLIPWRPEADATCSGGTAWRAGDGACYNGYAFTIEFDLRGLALTLPDEFVFGVAYNTNTWGDHPINLNGPYESLNVGLVTAAPSVGTNVETDAIFWNTMTPANYSDGGTAGVGIFRRDDNWTPYSPGIRFNAFAVATTPDGCKNAGWQSLTRSDASSFSNQGDCVSYTKAGK